MRSTLAAAFAALAGSAALAAPHPPGVNDATHAIPPHELRPQGEAWDTSDIQERPSLPSPSTPRLPEAPWSVIPCQPEDDPGRDCNAVEHGGNWITVPWRECFTDLDCEIKVRSPYGALFDH